MSELAKQIEQRARELMPEPSAGVDLPDDFIRQCLDANERGDGILYATINQGRHLYNTTPKDGEWLSWQGHVWAVDEFRSSLEAVEAVAMAYQGYADRIASEIDDWSLKKTDEDYWRISLHKKLESRVDRLRTENGAKKALAWAPVVDLSMACREVDLDNQPWLLPCRNGVIDLRTGVLLPGHPADLMTRAIDIDYDQHADSSEWAAFVAEVTGSDEVAAFLRRFFGYAVTGHSYEQNIAVFIGGGRNGKGVLFSCLAAVLGPYYHVISPAMLTEQKVDPSPNATSEHKYALMRKRLVVAGENKRGQRIDAGQIKGLTGDDRIECRPNFGKTINFDPTHTLCLHTNHMPVGIGAEFSLLQRLLRIDFPWAYVDDPEAEARKNPKMAGSFRPKDRHLKDRLMANRQGILRWLIDGCREWQQVGLDPPVSIQAAVDQMQRDADYIGLFVEDCLQADNIAGSYSYFAIIYAAFYWWWDNNRGDTKSCPKKPTVARELRERGIDVRKEGGNIKLFGLKLHQDINIHEIEAVAERLNRAR
ncbi:MAG: phage/plasmid primase, P4 family [Rhodocyclaceae bacterium]|nr:phage/plasmid primase, P4 family [Rhodocyclaceae bacterium]